MADIAAGAVAAKALGELVRAAGAGELWLVAEDDAGAVLGFQHLETAPGEGGRTARIATFLAEGAALAVGSRLFEASAGAARRMGLGFIEAHIARSNEAARIYYQSHGFRPCGETAARMILLYEID